MDQPFSETDVLPPPSIGPFRVLSRLGSGGMGTVYLAERTSPFKQQVAIKFFHQNPHVSFARSKYSGEAQTMASLDHENIVRLLDQGETESNAKYFVMEYVDGLPIDEFCKLGRVSLTGRIQILLKIVNAVACAHRHLVVHADLKPTNILVNAEGQPKLIDFGIAAMLRGTSVTDGTPFCSPLFAPPEQRAGHELSVASDIYTLGIVSGMLLLGIEPAMDLHQPDGFKHAIRRAPASTEIAAERSVTTQSLKKAARGDLGAILIRAAEIDPEQRYLSAEAFGDDLRRYVEGRPITARPGTRASRAWKWTLRNPRAAVLGTILLATVSLSAIGVTVQTVRATRQRRVAQLRLEDLVQLTGVLDGELYQSLGGLGQADAAKRTLLDGARQTLNHLADERGERADSDLVLEMSQQYEQLAGLEVNSVGSSHQEQRAQGAADAIRALTLLKTLPARMQEEPAIAKQYQDLQSLQQAGRPQ